MTSDHITSPDHLSYNSFAHYSHHYPSQRLADHRLFEKYSTCQQGNRSQLSSNLDLSSSTDQNQSSVFPSAGHFFQTLQQTATAVASLPPVLSYDRSPYLGRLMYLPYSSTSTNNLFQSTEGNSAISSTGTNHKNPPSVSATTRNQGAVAPFIHAPPVSSASSSTNIQRDSLLPCIRSSHSTSVLTSPTRDSVFSNQSSPKLPVISLPGPISTNSVSRCSFLDSSANTTATATRAVSAAAVVAAAAKNAPFLNSYLSSLAQSVSENQMDAHLKSHEEGGLQLDSEAVSDENKRDTANASGQFVCDVCGREFGMRCRLVAHARRHTGERPFSCSECGRAFSDQGNLQRHRYTHSSEPRFHCIVCGKYFRQASCLSNHRRFHCAGACGRPCIFCKRTFRSSSSLQMHLRWKHRSDAAAMVAAAVNATSDEEDVDKSGEVVSASLDSGACVAKPGAPLKQAHSDCGVAKLNESIRRKWRRKTKPKQMSPTRGVGTKTNKTGVRTIGELDLKDVADFKAMATAMVAGADLYLDRKGRPCNFACPACPRRFAFQCRLAAHMRCHTNIRPFICPDCGRAFTQKGYLARHGAVHRLERPFACNVCERAYKHYGSLVNHRRTHSKGGAEDPCSPGAASNGAAPAPVKRVARSKRQGGKNRSSALSVLQPPSAMANHHSKMDTVCDESIHSTQTPISGQQSRLGVSSGGAGADLSTISSIWSQNAFVPNLHQSNSVFPTSSAGAACTAYPNVARVGHVGMPGGNLTHSAYPTSSALQSAADSQKAPANQSSGLSIPYLQQQQQHHNQQQQVSSPASLASAFSTPSHLDSSHFKEAQPMLQLIPPHQGIFLKPYYFPPHR